MENDNAGAGDITLDTLENAYAADVAAQHPTTIPEEPQQLRLARFLRQVADFYEQHPTVTMPLWVADFSLAVYPYNDPKEFLSQIGSFEKKYKDHSYYAFSAVKHLTDGMLEFRFERDKVCTRKVVGKRVVPLQVRPAELVPEQVIPEHEEDIVVWECGEPLLKPDASVLSEEHDNV